jgi:hypothetical protein
MSEENKNYEPQTDEENVSVNCDPSSEDESVEESGKKPLDVKKIGIISAAAALVIIIAVLLIVLLGGKTPENNDDEDDGGNDAGYVEEKDPERDEFINALGGVSVPITDAEARFMNRTTRVKGFSAGESVHLNGTQALVYARIRKLDSEVERTRRQRELISSVVRNVKASSLADLDNAIETFLPYVTTNMPSTQILKYGTQALSEGWLKYDIVSMVEPAEEFRYGVDSFRTYTGNLFVWIVDYIRAARQLQLALYDQTNIEINPETHVSAIALAKGSSSNHYEGDYSDVAPDVDINSASDTTTEFLTDQYGNPIYIEESTTSEVLTDQYGNSIYFEETTTEPSGFLGDWNNNWGRNDEDESTTRRFPFWNRNEETTEVTEWTTEYTADEYLNEYPSTTVNHENSYSPTGSYFPFS